MKKRKMLLGLALLATSMFTLASCGNDDSSSVASSQAQSSVVSSSAVSSSATQSSVAQSSAAQSSAVSSSATQSSVAQSSAAQSSVAQSSAAQSSAVASSAAQSSVAQSSAAQSSAVSSSAAQSSAVASSAAQSSVAQSSAAQSSAVASSATQSSAAQSSQATSSSSEVIDPECLDEHHVHEICEGNIINHNGNCLIKDCIEYRCKCGMLLDYSYDNNDNIHGNGHNFENGVCKNCGEVESDFEIEVITPYECRITRYNFKSLDIVIPDEIYGFKVTEVSFDSYDCNDYINTLKNIKSINSLTIGNNVKYFNTEFRYREYGSDYSEKEVYVPIENIYYNSSIQDFVNIGCIGNALLSAENLFINGTNMKNLVLPSDIDLTNSYNTFAGASFESITLPDNLSTMGYNTFMIDYLPDSLFVHDQDGNSYLKSVSNDKYMLAKFSQTNTGELEIDSNVKMIYGPAWLRCNYNKIIINDNVKYFTNICSEQEIRYYEEMGYHVFKGEIKYTGSLESWFNKEFLRSSNAKYTSYYTSRNYAIGDILDIHNPVYLALKFSVGDLVLKESDSEYYYSPKGTITLDIPEGIENVNSYALEGCKFTRINIPASLKTIGTKALGKLTGINLDIANDGYASVYYAGNINDWLNIDFDSYLANPFVYEGDSTALQNRFYVNGELLTDLVIPEGVEEIKEGQFAGINSIISITFPSSLKYIDDCAFANCYGLYSAFEFIMESIIGSDKTEELLSNRTYDIIIPKNVKYIGYCAFELRSGGACIYIPKEVEYVSTYAMVSGKDPYYYDNVFQSYLFTDRENMDDLKWNFLVECNFKGYDQCTQLDILNQNNNYGLFLNTNENDIINDGGILYKKENENVILIGHLRNVKSEPFAATVYSNGEIVKVPSNSGWVTEITLSDFFYENINYITTLKYQDVEYGIILDENYFNMINLDKTSGAIFITKDVKEIRLNNDSYPQIRAKICYEGTLDEWNAICDSITPDYCNCTLVQK